MAHTIEEIQAINRQSKQLTSDEFKNQLVPLVQSILDDEFSDNQAKRTLKIYPDRINFACPFCGDSGHINSKKRGNIILRGKYRGLYKCHNCGVHMSVDRFFSKWKNIRLSSDALDYVYAAKKDASYESAHFEETTGLLFDTDYIEELCPDRETFRTRLELVEVNDATNPNDGRRYLINRCQYNFIKFLYSIRYNKLYVLNLTPTGKIFGCQVRDLSGNSEKNGMKYLSWNLTRVRKECGLEEDEESIDFDGLSLLFNALLTNFDKPVIVTEGPMDSFLIPNSIAMCGGAKNIPITFKLYYMFDGDDAGTEYAIEKLKDGKPVFMWSKFINDLELPKRKKWDFNDLIKYSREKGIKIPRLNNYFTESKFDIMNI